MPHYFYKCECGNKFDEFLPVSERNNTVCKVCGKTPDRDFETEFSGIAMDADDWGPGYNHGIGYHYRNKQDLMREIRARGYEPSMHDNGLTKARRPFYLDKEKLKITTSDIVVED
jgi:putative FmdB family regulatory protein